MYLQGTTVYLMPIPTSCAQAVRQGENAPSLPTVDHRYLRHSGIMHFSASVVSALHMDPSAGVILIIRCRFFIPIPQLALHSSHSPHSVTRQLLGAICNTKTEDQANGPHCRQCSHQAFMLIRCCKAKWDTYSIPHSRCISLSLRWALCTLSRLRGTA